jgi:hypothetical protein
MIDVIKKPEWKHVTFKTPTIEFMDWALKGGGVNIVINDKEYKFETQQELEALRLNLVPSVKGPDSCFIPISEMRSIYTKSKERIERIKLLNGKVWNKEELISKMYDDSFYYGELGKYALSSSAIKYLLD